MKNINKNDLDDPLLLQVLPSFLETVDQPPSYSQDPLDEKKYSPITGLIHQYKSRVLIIYTTRCAKTVVIALGATFRTKIIRFLKITG